MSALQGQFTGNGNSGTVSLPQNGNSFSLSLSGITGGASIALQRSYDGGTTWGTVQTYTADTQDTGYESIPTSIYRLVCSGYVSGTIKYTLG